MSEQEQAERLAKWLDSPPGTPAPTGLDAEVVEAIWALHSERAPAPRIDLDTLWEAAQNPLPELEHDAEAEVIQLSSRRWRRWIGGGTATAIATAATILFIVRQVPMEPIEGSRVVPTAPSYEEPVAAPAPAAKPQAEPARTEAGAPVEKPKGIQDLAESTAETPEVMKKSVEKAPAKRRPLEPPPPPEEALFGIAEMEADSIREITSVARGGIASSATGAQMGAARATRTDLDFEGDEMRSAAEAPAAAAPAMATEKKRKEATRERSRKKSLEKAAAPMSMEDAAQEDDIETLRRRARSQAALLLGQVTLDEATRALLLEAEAYLNSPSGPSPTPKLLQRADDPTTHAALKPQLWFLVGELYLSQGEQTKAFSAYSRALGH